ncbi:MAG: CBS domain-containing protein [Thaumarchaeota archaeon]|nr:CBS domain-containing protein [Nitrososphaerota archaeon]
MMKKVADIMTREVVTIEASKTAIDAAKVMAAQGVGCLLVVSPAKKAVGIVTERDLVSRVLAESFDPTKILVSDVMTTPLWTVSSDLSSAKAAEVMVRYKVRRLPVVDEDVLLGIITATDLASALSPREIGEESLSAITSAISRRNELQRLGPYR